MGPKKSEEFEFLTEEASAVRLQQKSILDVEEEVKVLHVENAEKVPGKPGRGS